MSRFTIPGLITALSTTFKTGTQLLASASAPRRGYVMGIDIGQIGAPNAVDCQIQYDLPRITAPSTTAVVYVPNDTSGGADAAASFQAGIGSSLSTDPTVTANSQQFNRAINQRNSFRWDANDRLAALIWPASANAGFALRGQNTVTGAFAGTGLCTLIAEE